MTQNIKWEIPFFDLNRQFNKLKDEVETAVCGVLRSGQYIEGPPVKKLEKEISEYLGVKHVITCGNGTDALRIALQANGIGQGDEVIVTAFSFFATAEAIMQTGATPVFADISSTHYNISADDIKKKLSHKTKAILPVHIFGMPADMDEINEIAVQNDIPVIEDACQAIGAQYKGKKTGTLGTMGCFSFYPTKNLGAFGDGGMITTDDDRLADICRAIKSHAAGKNGKKAREALYHEKIEELNLETAENGLYDPYKYYNYFTGGNSRLDSIQAAVLLVKLKYLNEFNKNRERIALKYSENLVDLPVRIPDTSPEDRLSCWHQYTILCDERDALIQYLAENGISTGNFYPIPLHQQKAFDYLNYGAGSLPVAEDICKKTVCLPIFPELYDDEITYISETIHNFFK